MSSRVLITGATGYVGNHTLHEFLKAGYRARVAVRSQESADKLAGIHKQFETRLEYAIVPDITIAGAFDEAVKGVDGIVHMASPFTRKKTDNELDLLKPAIDGTLRLLSAAAAYAPKVNRVVITSSFAAVNNFFKGLNPGYTYTENDWNPITYQQSKDNDQLAYAGSKKLAEQAAWDFVDREKPHFTIATICPPMIYGPPFTNSLTLKHLGTSAADIYALMDGSQAEVPKTMMPSWADVRDVALAHLRAYETDKPGRFLIASGRWSKQAVCDLLREKFPQLKDRVPQGTAGDDGPECYVVDASKAQKVLGINYTGFEDTFTDMARAFLEMEKMG